jgi:hypothetical protein
MLIYRTMKLIHIDRPCCYHISTAMPGISAIYQMEQEFFPYLVVRFTKNDGGKPGYILQTKHGDFRVETNFDKPSDVEELRAVIWEHMKKDYKIKDIVENGCINSFQNLGKNKVIQGWKAALKHRCTNCFANPLSEPEKYQLKSNNNPVFKPSKVTHQVYQLNKWNETNRLQNRPIMNKLICTNYKNAHCDYDLPKGSAEHRICKMENGYICAQKYPETGDNLKHVQCKDNNVGIEGFAPVNLKSIKRMFKNKKNILIIILFILVLYVNRVFIQNTIQHYN